MKRIIYLAMVLVMLVSVLPAASASQAATVSSIPRAIFFAADGMRQDLMERYASEGSMPTYADMIANGVTGENGLVQGFPPNTGVGWYTLATGNYPGEAGSTNNTFFRSGDANFNNSTSAFSSGVLQADTIAEAAERAGKKVASIEWSGGSRTMTALKGPVVDYRSFSSNRGLWTNWDVPGQPAGANAFGVQYQHYDLADASGWTNVPASFSSAKQGTFDLGSYTAGTPAVPVIANDQYDFYVYDSTNDTTTNYDHVLIVPNANAKDGSLSVANLMKGQWADVKVVLANPAGKTGGFYVKAQMFEPDLSKFAIFFSSVARSVATCTGCGYVGDFADDLNRLFPSSTGADYAIFESGLVDSDTYIEQGLMWSNAIFTYMHYIFGTDPVPTVTGGTVPGLGYKPDLLMLGEAVTDEFSHMFLGLTTPMVNGIANPYYNTYTEYGKLISPDVADGFLRLAYAKADETLALAKELVGGNINIFATSDHGFGSQWLAVEAGKVLFDAGLSTAEVSSNCRTNVVKVDTKDTYPDLAKACWAGGTAQIYVNSTLPKGTTYAQVRTAIVNAFNALTDPANPGAQVVLKVMLKEELRDVDGSDSLHPNRSGDVVVVLNPPYQFDAATKGQTIAFSQFFGQHGFLPETVSLADGVNMHATFVAAGPGIRQQDPVAGIRAIDLAPTLAFLLKVPGPVNARGKILYDLLPQPGQYKEATILYISDFHGQIVPLSQASDTLGPSFGIGGAAFLKPWLDWYRAESYSQGGYGSIFVTGGDTVGASPPISNFFGDLPTIYAMNDLGLSADTFGNHSFDRGSAYLRTVLIPASDYPYLASNVVFQSNDQLPPEWKASKIFTFEGFKLGVIGFTLPELQDLIFPGYLDPFKVIDPATTINAAAAQLRSKGKVNAVIAVGHMGIDLDASGQIIPTSPLLELASDLTGVDAVLGGHTHNQIITYQNGKLVAESAATGLRFTRIRLTVDTNTKAVVYETADWHKPWNIGITPDPTIQAMIDDLTADLAPLLDEVVGYSSVPIPRSDSCGQAEGRKCESLVGDVTADALRTTYTADFGITNSGGLRASLTCPTTDVLNDNCPASLYPFAPGKIPITRGTVLAVLPFGNLSFTVNITGAQLKTYLENGVSLMPSAQGRFPQVSGLCFTYDVAAAAGSRVLSVVRQAENGSCTAIAVDLTGASTYAIVENDFMASGGDGYPNVYAAGTTQNIMYLDLENFIADTTPISPTIQGRIVCTDSDGPGIGNDCPVVLP